MGKIKILFAAVVVSGIALSNAFAAQFAVKPKKDIALQLYSLRDAFKKDYNGTMEKVGKMGFSSAESAGYKDGKFYGKSPKDFRADAEKIGLKLVSSHAHKKISHEQYEARDFSETLKWWDECIAAHKDAGMKYVVIPSISVPKNKKELDGICEFLNEVGKRCKAAGLKLGYHNHAHELKKVDDEYMMFDYMIENTNPEYVFYQMDVYWIVMGQQSPVEYFKKYPGRFKLLHLKDRKELGRSGMVGFDAIFANVEIAGVEGVMIEVEKYDFDPFVSVQMSLDYLLKNDFVPVSYKK